MPRNGSGGYSLPEAAFTYDTVISETAVNSDLSDIANALTASIAKDGQTTPTANLPMGTFRHTGVGNASARNDYAAAGQVQDGSFTWCGTAGGTINALTLTPTPAITAYATGQRFVFQAGSSPSDDAVTIAVSGLTAKAAEINDAALSASVVIVADKYYEAFYDGTAFQLTRVSSSLADVSGPASATDGAYVQFDGTSGKVLKETAATVLEAGTTRTLTAGFSSDVEAIGNSGTGTQTLEVSSSKENFKTMTINGSFTLAPQAATSVILIIATNDGTGGYTITTSGYDLVSGSYNNTASAVHLFESIVIGSVQILRITEIA
jgi:hypothetical protein